MGWFGTKQTRAEAVKAVTTSHEGATCIAFTEVPVGVWSVWEFTNADLERSGKRIIVLSLIESRDGYQMVKDMDETSGPHFYDCPLSYLDLAGDYATEAYSPKWRDKVRDYHGAPRTPQGGFGLFVPADGVSHDD